MLNFSDIYSFFETFAPSSLQEPYDNSGCLLSSEAEFCTGVLFALDLTQAVLKEAIEKKCNLIVTHHPFLFKSFKKIGHFTIQDQILRRCIQENIAIYAIHTNLDKIKTGVNGAWADFFGLKNIEILAPEVKNSEIGLGCVGILPKKMEIQAFLQHLKEKMALKVIRHSNLIFKEIQKIAFCGGAGFSLLPQVLAQKADIFITADLKYHDFFSAENQIILVDIGHYESEKHSIMLLHEVFTKKFYNFVAHSTTVDTNSIHYLI